MSDDLAISATIEGVEGVKEYFAAAGESIRDRIRQALIDSGRLVQARAQATTAFHDVTGELRASIQPYLAETDRALSVTIKPGDHVGLFLEGGVVAYGGAHNKRARASGKRGASRAVRMARRAGDRKYRTLLRAELAKAGGWRIEPRHFMRDAFASVRNQVADTIETALEQGVADTGR